MISIENDDFKIKKGDAILFSLNYDQMKQKIINNPDMLYKDYWKK